MGGEPVAHADVDSAGRPPFPEWRKWAIVVLVIALALILVLVLIEPSYGGGRAHSRGANEKAAQSGLRNAIAAAKWIFTDADDYSGVSSESLTLGESSLSFVTTNSTGPNVISWDVRTTDTEDDTIDLAALSKSGNCYYLEDVAASGTTYGQRGSGQSECAGTDAAGVSGKYWQSLPYPQNPWAWSHLKWWLVVAILVAIAVLLFAPRRFPRSGDTGT